MGDDYKAKFLIGQIIRHKLFNYRGVIFDIDPFFQSSDEWYEQVARSRPPKNHPWYHVLVDGAEHSTYVAERHLVPSELLGQISHPALGQYFARFDGTRYYGIGPVH